MALLNGAASRIGAQANASALLREIVVYRESPFFREARQLISVEMLRLFS